MKSYHFGSPARAEIMMARPEPTAGVRGSYPTGSEVERPLGPLDLPTSRGERAQLRVLVVDEDEDAADLLSLLLHSKGHDCHIAYTGGAALGLAAEFAPHLVLLSLGLPDISGYEVARRLQDQRGSHVPYLAAVTGWGQASDRDCAIAAGFDHHVLTPVKHAALDEIVRAAQLRLAARVPVG